MLPRVIKELRNSLVPHKFCWARVPACENSRHFVACGQALQFGLAKWASRERANEVLRSSLARSRETRFTRPNRRDCSQANILRRHHWFASEMTSEIRAQKFHIDDVSPPRWLLVFGYSYQKTVGRHLDKLEVSLLSTTCIRRSAVTSDGLAGKFRAQKATSLLCSINRSSRSSFSLASLFLSFKCSSSFL